MPTIYDFGTPEGEMVSLDDYRQLEAENVILRHRLTKWENWKPDNDDLLAMQEQAESAKSLAAYAAYVGMLEHKYREQQERVAELETSNRTLRELVQELETPPTSWNGVRRELRQLYDGEGIA